MNLHNLLGWLLRIDNIEAIDRFDVAFAARWARQAPAWLFFASLALVTIAVVFYWRYQSHKQHLLRGWLAAGRATVLCTILLCLAEPVLTLRLTSGPRPWLWLLFDGSDSMGIADEYPESESASLEKATGAKPLSATPGETSATGPVGSGLPSSAGSVSGSGRDRSYARVELVKAALTKEKENTLRKLSEKYRLRGFVFAGADTVREIAVHEEKTGLKPEEWAKQLTTDGQTTAVGRALEELSLRQNTGNLSGILLFSDFDQNAGPAPLAAAKKLGVPVQTIGVGVEAAADISIDLQTPLLLKKAERTTLTAIVRSNGVTDETVRVRMSVRRLASGGGSTTGTSSNPGTLGVDEQTIGERSVRISAADLPVEFPFTPTETGRFAIVASVEGGTPDRVSQNDRTEREVSVRDDFLRLMYVEYEPTWEWRFVKEVFHRDQLVGMRGFRTFLRSADPNVRRSNELFLATLTPKRSEFFAHDVLFLGDMPASTLSTRFCEMTKEFVSKFGGGLVVIAGPRFGPNQLAGTPLADMLPVVLDPSRRIKDDKPFRMQLTPEAEQYDFMQMGENEAENRLAWNNLGPLPWYQPVERLHPLATALASHPNDLCADGKTKQPLIATRRFGRGEVIYLGFNETWRLRKKYGEKYYRQLWGQMIHRLGLSHALGSQKRFVVRTDRQQYQPDEKVLLTVEAYDANFEPLTEETIPERKLVAELIQPGLTSDGQAKVKQITIPQFREGVFETRIPLDEGGEHRISVIDPITQERSEVHFQVTSVSVERRSAVRNAGLQREIASGTGGRSFDLTNWSKLADDFEPPPKREAIVRVIPLWNTWFCFGLVVTLLLGEWLTRKLVNLP